MLFYRLSNYIILATAILCFSPTSNARMTVFIHGTLPPVLDKLVHFLDIPWGLTPAYIQGNRYYMGRIPFILSSTDPTLFPLKDFYLYGWSGDLDFISRKQAAHTLYHTIKQVNKNKSPITLIGHSHGGNVALNLAAVAAEHNDKDFVIDKLILLAVPIQQATAQYICSPVFKKIYSLYSPTDIIQVLDPQGLYTTQITDQLFSARTLNTSQAKRVIQASLSINTHDPGHMSFISADFMKLLPRILHTLDTLAEHAKQINILPHFALHLSTRSNTIYKIQYRSYS